MIEHSELLRLLSYDPVTGYFRWRVRRAGVSTTKNAGTLRKDGYIQIRYDGQFYLAHRLAWFYMTGEWPANEIDHKNGKRAENWWGNLREATSSQNKANAFMQANNTSGIKGVSWDKRANKWLACIVKDGKRYHVGLFDSKEEAGYAYAVKAEQLFGEYGKIHVCETRCKRLLIEANLEDFE